MANDILDGSFNNGAASANLNSNNVGHNQNIPDIPGLRSGDHSHGNISNIFPNSGDTAAVSVQSSNLSSGSRNNESSACSGVLPDINQMPPNTKSSSTIENDNSGAVGGYNSLEHPESTTQESCPSDVNYNNRSNPAESTSGTYKVRSKSSKSTSCASHGATKEQLVRPKVT